MMRTLPIQKQPAVLRFVQAAECYEKWARGGSDRGKRAAQLLVRHLAELFSAGLLLPDPGRFRKRSSEPDRVSLAEWKKIRDAARKRLPLEYYSEVFNPLPVPPDEPIAGSLSDDIADVFRDVVSGLRLFRAGYEKEALWDWRFSLWCH